MEDLSLDNLKYVELEAGQYVVFFCHKGKWHAEVHLIEESNEEEAAFKLPLGYLEGVPDDLGSAEKRFSFISSRCAKKGLAAILDEPCGSYVYDIVRPGQ